MHRGHLCREFTFQRFDATPLGQERNSFRRALRRSAALQRPRSKVRFDFGLSRNALRNVKGILNYTVWGVPSGIVEMQVLHTAAQIASSACYGVSLVKMLSGANAFRISTSSIPSVPRTECNNATCSVLGELTIRQPQVLQGLSIRVSLQGADGGP
jgi:hypothetical protein